MVQVVSHLLQHGPEALGPIRDGFAQWVEAHEYDNEFFKDKVEQFHQLDEVYLNHLRDLGLDDEGDIAQEQDSPDSAGEDGNDLVDFV